MKLTSTEKITLEEAIDVLASCNDEKHLGHLMAADRRKPWSAFSGNDFKTGERLLVCIDGVRPQQLARWAAQKGLELPRSLRDLVPDYDPLDVKLRDYRPELIDKLRRCLAELDAGDHAKDKGEGGLQIIARYYPDMSHSLAEKALRTLRHILYPDN